MNAASNEVIDAEDMHRRCALHHEFLANSPGIVAFAEDSADRNLDDLAEDDLVRVGLGRHRRRSNHRRFVAVVGRSVQDDSAPYPWIGGRQHG